MAKLAELRRAVARYITEPVVRLIERTRLTPDTITWIGFLVAIGAAVMISMGHLFTAGLAVIVAGFLDILDGALARRTNRTTRFGGVLDSTIDRLSEAVILLGILIFYARSQSVVPILVVGVTLPSSLLVSYIRARAEAIGLECQVGLFTRTERVIVLAIGLCLGHIVEYALLVALTVIAVFSLVTVVQRLLHVWQQTRG
ncbi:phosphatidylinositol phosphate synthase [Chloroflexota bacterium]